jgi:fimbrial protein
LMEGQKSAVVEYYADKGKWPKNNTEAGIAAPTDIKGKYVAQVAVGTNGVLTATMKNTDVNNDIKGKTVMLSPDVTGNATSSKGSFTWTCKKGTVDSKFLPSSCR